MGGERVGDGLERGGLVRGRDGVEDGAADAAVGEVVGGVGGVVAEAEGDGDGSAVDGGSACASEGGSEEVGVGLGEHAGGAAASSPPRVVEEGCSRVTPMERDPGACASRGQAAACFANSSRQ